MSEDTTTTTRPAGSWPGWCQRCARPMVKGSGTWCSHCGTTDADDGNYDGGFEWLYSQTAALIAERDTARDIAALLEHDVARLESVLDAVDAHFAAVEAEPGGPWTTPVADVRLVVAQLRAASTDAALDDADGA